MHGWINSFEVELDGQHVVMCCHDPSEGQNVTVRVSHTELETMLRACPTGAPPVPPQTATR
jgi:hypothetical protein